MNKDLELEHLVNTVDLKDKPPGQSVMAYLAAKLKAARASEKAKKARAELAIIANEKKARPAKPNVVPFPPAPSRYANDADDALVMIVRKGYAPETELAAIRAELSRRGITIHKKGFSKSQKH